MNTNTNVKQATNNKNKKIIALIVKIALIIGIYLIITAFVEFHILNRKYTALLVPIGINIILAVSLNLVTGFLGELSLGHAGFMSIGAFTGALFTLNLNLPGNLEFLLAIIIGGAIAALFGFLIGVPVLRLRGDYLAIVTLAFGEIIRSIITTLSFPAGRDKAGELIVKKGTMGLSGIATYANYTWVYVAVIITIVVCVNFVNSRHGRMITSIRDNIIAAESIGIKTSKYKILAFVIAAFFAGAAGVIGGHNISIIKPSDYGYDRSIDILVFVVLGGMGSIRGSIIAAVILTLLPEALRPIENYRMLMYAVLLIAMMIFNHSNLKNRMQESDRFSKLTQMLKFGK
ncbi:MAG: branched-chain amino acid transporter permease [Herbinix sp.]|jgi:branched-chain amino acid transport system permease protein|nr:branched-chain amino acid transporter permease [Herbinix sp.]